MRNSIESSFNETTLEVAAGGDVDDDAKKKVYVYYREVQLNLTPEIEILFKRFNNGNGEILPSIGCYQPFRVQWSPLVRSTDAMSFRMQGQFSAGPNQKI